MRLPARPRPDAGASFEIRGNCAASRAACHPRNGASPAHPALQATVPETHNAGPWEEFPRARIRLVQLLGVEVRFQDFDERLQRLVRAVAFRAEHDHVAVGGTEAHQRQDA